MRMPVRLILLLGVPLVAWLVLGMPTGEDLAAAWLPASVFALFWILTLFQGALLRLSGVDLDVYGNSVAWFSIVPCLAAALVGLACAAVALYGGDAVRDALNGSIALGLAILWLMGVLVVPTLFARRTLGEAGTRPIEDPRTPMRSAPRPPRSMADFAQGGAQSPPREPS